MIGDGGKRKRAAKQTAAKPDEDAVLAEAERRLRVAREHLATLRHGARTAHSEMRSRLADADAELRKAGLELRAPRGADEMQVEAQRFEWQVHALDAQIVGAERGSIRARLSGVTWLCGRGRSWAGP
jgi:hypothetical protein